MYDTKQSSGHTLRAEHIEKALEPFYVKWYSPAYTNVLRFEGGWRWAKVMAETPEGALHIAKYHHFRGQGFLLIESPPVEFE